jgi:hypothetical protein
MEKYFLLTNKNQYIVGLEIFHILEEALAQPASRGRYLWTGDKR